MSNFDIDASLASARLRLSRHPMPSSRRRLRSDAGTFRMDPRAEAALRARLLGQERPNVSRVLGEVRSELARAGVPTPSRATIYTWMGRAPAHSWSMSELPEPVRAVLHNVDPDAPIPGWQIAFRSFQDGDIQAVTWASGMPWWDLWQARRARGWRPRSRGLLDAACLVRGIR